MANRPERVADQIRVELSHILAREVHDPGVGFVTITRVRVSPDLMLARVYYTVFGDDKTRHESDKALKRALPFLRRQVGQRVKLRRVPELQLFYDETIAHQDRIEQILHDLHEESAARPSPETPTDASERVEASGGAQAPDSRLGDDDHTDDDAGDD